VIWSKVVWCDDHSCSTDTGDGRTWEDVYKGWTNKSNVLTLSTVTADDVDFYGKPRYKIALEWANNIRAFVNGWNCTKSPDYSGLVASGYIPQLAVPSGVAPTSGSHSATYYGAGEFLPSLGTANGDIFHTNDLTVAISSGGLGGYSYSKWKNKWVEISYGGKSVVARVTDISGGPIDLSAGGVADYLGFPGSGTVNMGHRDGFVTRRTVLKAGAALVTGVALPALRIGSSSALTALGWSTFLEAVGWATGPSSMSVGIVTGLSQGRAEVSSLLTESDRLVYTPASSFPEGLRLVIWGGASSP
jgi:hypothetical protein